MCRAFGLRGETALIVLPSAPDVRNASSSGGDTSRTTVCLLPAADAHTVIVGPRGGMRGAIEVVLYGPIVFSIKRSSFTQNRRGKK